MLLSSHINSITVVILHRVLESNHWDGGGEKDGHP